MCIYANNNIKIATLLVLFQNKCIFYNNTISFLNLKEIMHKIHRLKLADYIFADLVNKTFSHMKRKKITIL